MFFTFIYILVPIQVLNDSNKHGEKWMNENTAIYNEIEKAIQKRSKFEIETILIIIMAVLFLGYLLIYALLYREK